MDTQHPSQRYSLTHLENYIALHELLTGSRPESLEVTADFYTWYIQECARHAEHLGMNIGFKDEPRFLGMKLEKKVKVETK